MTTAKSGVILIAVGIGMNLVGRVVVLETAAKSSHSPALAGAMALWMIVSVVICLFGFFRLVMGWMSKKKQREPMQTEAKEGTWPPAPKPPGAG